MRGLSKCTIFIVASLVKNGCLRFESSLRKKNPLRGFSFCAGERTRTSTSLRIIDFESIASTIPPHRHRYAVVITKATRISSSHLSHFSAITQVLDKYVDMVYSIITTKYRCIKTLPDVETTPYLHKKH